MSCTAEAPISNGSLDLLEGIVASGIPDPVAEGCGRWPETLRLLNQSTGELVRGRCRATNLCVYCQRLYVQETVEMLCLDAAEYAPTLWTVLTAREHLTRDQCRVHLNHIRRVLRREWASVEWFVQVEFQRRGALHLNLLLKGVTVEDEAAFHAAISAAWCARVDALPAGQWTQSIADGEGVLRYISKQLAHGLKAEQAPPIGWRGHRTSQTRGYLVRPASQMRLEARRSIRVKRQIYYGLDALEAERQVAAASLVPWSLAHIKCSTLLPASAAAAVELDGSDALFGVSETVIRLPGYRDIVDVDW